MLFNYYNNQAKMSLFDVQHSNQIDEYIDDLVADIRAETNKRFNMYEGMRSKIS